MKPTHFKIELIAANRYWILLSDKQGRCVFSTYFEFRNYKEQRNAQIRIKRILNSCGSTKRIKWPALKGGLCLEKIA